MDGDDRGAPVLVLFGRVLDLRGRRANLSVDPERRGSPGLFVVQLRSCPPCMRPRGGASPRAPRVRLSRYAGMRSLTRSARSFSTSAINARSAAASSTIPLSTDWRRPRSVSRRVSCLSSHSICWMRARVRFYDVLGVGHFSSIRGDSGVVRCELLHWAGSFGPRRWRTCAWGRGDTTRTGTEEESIAVGSPCASCLQCRSVSPPPGCVRFTERGAEWIASWCGARRSLANAPLVLADEHAAELGKRVWRIVEHPYDRLPLGDLRLGFKR